ncbi:MAG: glycerate kinase, partial [Verrucomicrobiota bacterium]
MAANPPGETAQIDPDTSGDFCRHKCKHMKIAIAPNAFKGSLTASQAADCIQRGLSQALPGSTTVRIPMADGG